MVMQPYDQRKAGVILSYLNIGIKTAAGFLYTPLIIRFLGQENYGIYQLCTSSIGYLTLFNAGMNAAYIRFYVQTRTTGKKEEVEKLNGMFALIFFILTIGALIVGLVISRYPQIIFGTKITADEYVIIKQLLFLLTLNTSITILNCIFSSLIIANEKFVIAKSILLITTIMTALANMIALFKGLGTPGIVATTTVCNLFSLLAAAFICLVNLRIHFVFKGLKKPLFYSIMAFSTFIFLQTVMDQLNWQIDQFLLARFSGSQEIAIYALGSQLNSYYILLGTTISEVFLPQINVYVAKKESDKIISKLFIKVARLQFIFVIYIMLGFIYFGKYFMQLWGGEGFGDSYYVALLLMLPVTVSLTQSLGPTIMRAKNKHQLQILLNFMVCVLNLLISIPLCKMYGAIGGAVGTFVGLMIICVAIQYLYHKKVGKIDMNSYLKEMASFLPALIIPILYGVIIISLHLVNSLKSMIGYGLLFTILYVTSLWMFGMNTEEKNLIRKFFPGR